jgi:methylated-DNA-[protein]-cysteine S-methyltransferase
MSTTESLEEELARIASAIGTEEAPEVAAAATEAGVVDIAYATHDSPVGKLLLAATPRGLLRIAYVDVEGQEVEAVLERLAARVSPRILLAPRRLDDDRRQLEQYFTGKRRVFELPLDLRLRAGFSRRVLDATARVSFGELVTYKQVATAAGSPGASRAAGNALGANPLPIVVPCHRVVHSGGGLGGYTGGLERKVALLGVEGHTLQ